jgi:hypothetical protein
MQMQKDACWSIFLSDDTRYADFVNGYVFRGAQVVTDDSIQERDTKVWLKILSGTKTKYLGKTRDMVRKVIFGVNFAIIGIENQETIDYAFPVRNMIYDAGEYEKQLKKIRKHVKKNSRGLIDGEYLYGFRKTDRLKPVVTFLLYSGEEPWQGPEGLWDMLDFTDISEQLKRLVQDYRINVVDIRRLEDTSVFHTDIKEVFDFIKYSNDKNKLKELVEGREYYRHMEEDAFETAVNYANAEELKIAKEKYGEGGKVNMCTAIQELMADSRNEGIEQGIQSCIVNMLMKNFTYEDIIEITGCSQETIDSVKRNLMQD